MARLCPLPLHSTRGVGTHGTEHGRVGIPQDWDGDEACDRSRRSEITISWRTRPRGPRGRERSEEEPSVEPPGARRATATPAGRLYSWFQQWLVHRAQLVCSTGPGWW